MQHLNSKEHRSWEHPKKKKHCILNTNEPWSALKRSPEPLQSRGSSTMPQARRRQSLANLALEASTRVSPGDVPERGEFIDSYILLRAVKLIRYRMAITVKGALLHFT